VATTRTSGKREDDGAVVVILVLPQGREARRMHPLGIRVGVESVNVHRVPLQLFPHTTSMLLLPKGAYDPSVSFCVNVAD
jgi:hypothetical protein